VTIAAVARSFTLTTVACNNTPNAFTFITQANVPVGSVRTSNTVTISGINGATPVSVSGGEYSIGCTATFTSASGSINPSQTICVRQSASSATTR
jgi:hypothetical protein